MISLRRPAPPDFLERRRAVVDWNRWGCATPGEGSRGWLVETCRAELEWVEAEWRRLGGDPFEVSRDRQHPDGPHPSEALRLPHEQAAARLVNCHLHADGAERQIRDAIRRLKAQRKAARDATQGRSYRDGWARIAAETEKDLVHHRGQRAGKWRAFLAATVQYRDLRRALDVMERHATERDAMETDRPRIAA